ncbi:RAB GTPase H1E isoform 1 [Hibiscus syriacus]|uniref:RAB GTPase H1E isoform 1 n=1 Tax=Hibiscus syriacus TaxID=106335 RepID=A0A6A2ZX22_HIBSY|nr:RAB GTPase H1E isoform 1 [Hibiscus syriacus]
MNRFSSYNHAANSISTPSAISVSFLEEASEWVSLETDERDYQDIDNPPDEKDCFSRHINHDEVAMVGLEAMERANSTLEDFGQDVYSISVLPEEGNTNPKCTPQLTFLSLVEVPFSSKNQMRLDAQLSCHNCIDLKVDSEDAYSSCILDVNIEKEIPDILTSSDENVGNSKSEGVLKACKHFLIPIWNDSVPIFLIINGIIFHFLDAVKFGDIDIDLSDVES